MRPSWMESRFASVIVLVVLAFATGCQSADSTRAQLRSAQDEWAKSVSRLRARQTETQSLLQLLASDAHDDDPAEIAATRQLLTARVEGVRQGLNDFDLQKSQAIAEVEAGIARSSADAQAALDAVLARMADYLHAEDENITSTMVAITTARQGAPRTATP